MTLDGDVVRGRCQEIEQSIERLDRIRTDGRDSFLANRDAQDIACYRLLVAIEAALALCYHVSARRLRSAPEDYADCFIGLEKQASFPRPCQVDFNRWRASETYWCTSIGPWTMGECDVLEHDLGDLREFSQIVASLV